MVLLVGWLIQGKRIGDGIGIGDRHLVFLQTVGPVPREKQSFPCSSPCKCWDAVDLWGQETFLGHRFGALAAVTLTNLRLLGFSPRATLDMSPDPQARGSPSGPQHGLQGK